MTAAGTLLAGRDLRVRYGGRTVLDLEAIDLRAGELLAVFGPNGAGKSTLLRVLSMLEPPTSGVVEFRGATGARAASAMREASGVVFQKPYFWRETVAYNVGLGLKLRGVSRADSHRRVVDVCRQLRIDELLSQPVTSLSGGQTQRVSLARALVLEPEILFLDEPTANLDADSRADLRDDLERVVRERAASVFMITHDRNEALYLADRVGVLRDGRLVQIGTPTDIYENPADPYTARLTGAEFSIFGRVLERAERTLTVDVAGTELRALGSADPGDTVKIAYRPEDLVLGPPDVTGPDLSIRNLVYATIRDRRDLGGLVRLRLDGPAPLVALVTAEAAEQLDLVPGKRTSVRIKATALHAFAVPAARDPASTAHGAATRSGKANEPGAANEQGAATASAPDPPGG